MRTYGPSATVAVCGVALWIFAALATADAAVVGGIVMGAVALTTAAVSAVEVAQARRYDRDRLTDRTLRRLTQGEER